MLFQRSSKLALLALVIITGFSSCTIFTNTYDSATMLKKRQLEIQGAYSIYPFYDDLGAQTIGGRLSYGLTDWCTVKLKTEAAPLISLKYFETNHYYSEFESKFKISNSSALSLDLQMYGYNYSKKKIALDYYSVGLIYYYTQTNHKNTFDASLITRFYYSNYLYLEPSHWRDVNYKNMWGSIGFGCGFSKNLDKWAIRPEISMTPFWGFGIGFSYKFGGDKLIKRSY